MKTRHQVAVTTPSDKILVSSMIGSCSPNSRRCASFGVTSSIGYEERRLLNIEAKEKVGRIAANLIPHDCSVILNIGTTTEQVARALANHSGLVVISNNINVIQILRDAKLRDLVIVGGGVRRSDGAIVGDDAVDSFQNMG